MNPEETVNELDSEIEAHSPESWRLIDESEGTNPVLQEASKGVADATDRGYRRLALLLRFLIINPCSYYCKTHERV